MIPFNVPPCVGDELDYVKQAIDSHKICGDGAFTKQCNAWLEERFHAQKVLLTTSGTTALDMAMLLCDIHPGDEVIAHWNVLQVRIYATEPTCCGDILVKRRVNTVMIIGLQRQRINVCVFEFC